MLRDGRAVIKLRPSKLLMHTMQSLKICSRTLYTNLQGPRVPTKSAVLFAAVGTRTCMLRDGRGCYKITANETCLCTRYFLFQYTLRAYIPIYRALGRQKKSAVLFTMVVARTHMLGDRKCCYKITVNETCLCTRYFLFLYNPRAHIPICRALGRQKKAQFSLQWLLLVHACSETVEAVIK